MSFLRLRFCSLLFYCSIVLSYRALINPILIGQTVRYSFSFSKEKNKKYKDILKNRSALKIQQNTKSNFLKY